MSIGSELREAIFSLLDQKGALTYAQIRSNHLVEALADNEKQISNTVYNLKKYGHIDRDNDGYYYITEDGAAAKSSEKASSGRQQPAATVTALKAVPAPAPEEPDPEEPEEPEQDEEQPDPETEEEAEDDATWYRQDYVQQLLEQQEDAAQKALDAYIMQVVAEHGQRDTLNALMAARDRARDALLEVTIE